MADKRVGKRSMGRRGRSIMESGTCNVCSSPCSSCMHRTAGFMGSKSDDSSDEACHGIAASQCSVNEDDAFLHSSKLKVSSNPNTASEASNLVNSNHDAFIDNAESKEIIRSEVSDDLGTVEMSSKSSSSKMAAVANVLDQSSKCDKGETKLIAYQRNKKAGHKDSSDCSALVSDPEFNGSNKTKGSMKIDSSNAPGESSHRDSDSSDTVNIKEKSGTTEGPIHSGHDNKKKIPQINKDEEPNSSATCEDETDDTELVETDVKVCDICGDAGCEDLLAICSRCSDGAEHTYCMREMLEELPKGDWLCEECKFAEEAEKQKLEAKEKRETEMNFNARSLGKRHAEKDETAPDAKRHAVVEDLTDSPKRSIPPKAAAVISREPSFKGLEKPKRKPVHQDDAESTHSSGSQLQSPKGTFFKSNSFNANSKPKVKLVEDVVLPRQRPVKEYASHDTKEGVSRTLGKSMSFKSTELGCSSGYDSKLKPVPSKFHHLKEQSTEANFSAPIGDQKLLSRSNSSLSNAKNTRDLKGLQADGKLGRLTKQASNLTRNRPENTASVSESSIKEKGSSIEQIANQASRKDEPLSIVGSAKGSREIGSKSKDGSVNRARPSHLTASKGLASLKEGQTAEPMDTSCTLPSSDLSTTRNVREDINTSNRLRAAVDAALRKKPSFSKNRGSEQSESSSTGIDLSQQLPPKIKNSISPEGGQGTITTNGKQLELSSQSVDVVRDSPLSRTSAIPEHEYIWLGDLEVQRSGNLSVMHCGIQAHLSTLASPKVLEVVNKFSVKVSLNEEPRLSTWPAQFRDVGVNEEHIALFFFAKDIECYEKSYKPLVDNMIKNDLALKGSFGGVELLIFASNQLPQHCQRWNMLYFLWGVFRGRKGSPSNPLKSPSLPLNSNAYELSRKHMEKTSSACEITCKTIEVGHQVGLVVSHEDGDHKESSVECSSTGSETSAKDSDPCSRFRSQSCPIVEKNDPREDGAMWGPQRGPIDIENSSSTSSLGDTLAKKAAEDKADDNRRDPPLTVSRPKRPFLNDLNSEDSGPRDHHDHDHHDHHHGDAGERIVFPVDLNDGKGEMEMEEEAIGMISPKLELGLGANMEALPLFAATAMEHGHRQTPEEKYEEEGEAASLSLSLSFPFLDKDSEEGRREENVNSSNTTKPLFLFGDKSS